VINIAAPVSQAIGGKPLFRVRELIELVYPPRSIHRQIAEWDDQVSAGDLPKISIEMQLPHG
jgi:hypothetical protein